MWCQILQLEFLEEINTRFFYLKAQQKAADYFSEKIQSVQCCNPQDVQVMIKVIDDYWSPEHFFNILSLYSTIN